MTTLIERLGTPTAESTPFDRPGLWGWMTSTDHKRIGVCTLVTAFVLFVALGCVALTMRVQLAQPNQHLISTQVYNTLMTIHGSGMIYLVVTPIAIAMGVYLVPLQIGAPRIAAPRVVAFAFWLYLAGALLLLCSAGTSTPPTDGWYAYTPLATSRYTPGIGMDLWLLGAFIAVCSQILSGGCVLWTIVRLRAPGMTMLKLPVFTWSMVATCVMIIAAFPALLAADGLIAVGRLDPNLMRHNLANIGYQMIFWFYGHPVVYVMFFPFVGAVAETLAVFARKKYFGYKFTVGSLLAFSALSSAVWGHHMFTTGQEVDDYYSLTSILLSVPAGIEYFGFLATLIGGRIQFRTAMLFALAFIPQFLIGGLTGIMLGAPVLDYQFHGSYFVVAHFHYTLLAGSMFGFFAGVYLWFPKVTGIRLREDLGKWNFWLMTIGTNTTFLPMFVLGYLGLPRREATYPAGFGFGPWALTSTIGSGILAVGILLFIVNVVESIRHPVPAGDDPWEGHSLEWATSSPPPRFNYDGAHRIPRITSFAPLYDRRLALARAGLPGAGETGEFAKGHMTEEKAKAEEAPHLDSAGSERPGSDGEGGR